MDFQLTPEQTQAVELSTQNQRLKMLAYAGAGKTSTIALIAKKLGEMRLRGIYLAFNKAIADEAGRKMPPSTVAKTFHSLAFGSVDRQITAKLKKGQGFYANTFATWANYNVPINVTGDSTKHRPKGITNQIETVDNNKRFKIIKTAIELFLRSDDDKPKNWHLRYAVDTALNMVVADEHKQYLVSEFMPILERLWYDYQHPNGHFQITHDVYLKIYALSHPKINYDFILFDESQDTDKLMLGILKDQTNRIIFVGDPYQQIYEWRGAVDAMQQFEGAETYLTQSFRFGAEIASLANGLLKYLRAEKPLIGAGKQGFINTSTQYPRDIQAILCRTNAGAISNAIDYQSHHPKKRLFLELSSNPQQMIDLLKAIHDFEKEPEKGVYHEILVNFNNFMELKDYCEQFPDDQNISGIFRLYQKYGYEYLARTLESFKSNQKFHDTVVTTVHKSKGREWDNVLLADDFEGRSYLEKEKGFNINNDSEARLLYVAVTRAKTGLYGVNIKPLIDYLNKLLLPRKSPIVTPVATNEETNNTPLVAIENKRKYTKRNGEAEQKRLEAYRIAHKKAVELGTVGRPKALADDSTAQAIELIKLGELSLPKIAKKLGVSLSTIKRIKSAQKSN